MKKIKNDTKPYELIKPFDGGSTVFHFGNTKKGVLHSRDVDTRGADVTFYYDNKCITQILVNGMFISKHGMISKLPFYSLFNLNKGQTTVKVPFDGKIKLKKLQANGLVVNGYTLITYLHIKVGEENYKIGTYRNGITQIATNMDCPNGLDVTLKTIHHDCLGVCGLSFQLIIGK